MLWFDYSSRIRSKKWDGFYGGVFFSDVPSSDFFLCFSSHSHMTKKVWQNILSRDILPYFFESHVKMSKVLTLALFHFMSSPGFTQSAVLHAVSLLHTVSLLHAFRMISSASVRLPAARTPLGTSFPPLFSQIVRIPSCDAPFTSLLRESPI